MKFFSLPGLWTICISLLLCSGLFAKPVSQVHAKRAITGLLKLNQNPMGTALGSKIKKIETHADPNGQDLYYIVSLENSFLIVAADDEIEPVIAIVSGTDDIGTLPGDPLVAMLESDMSDRIAQVHAAKLKKALPLPADGKRPIDKWATLITAADSNSGPLLAAFVSSVSDIRVASFVQSRWNQTTICNYTQCYNYYTPGHVYCGCVATAMAQLMRYFQHPATGIGVKTFSIALEEVLQNASTLGGDGAGGPYNWGSMSFVPDCSTTTAQRAQIGALCYDAGISVNMHYSVNGSGAYMSDAADQLKTTFKYNNVIGTSNVVNTAPMMGLMSMVNPNLDARLPVLFGIRSSSSGHAIVADGYGYTGSTLYHHLNLGWGGYQDAWYNLPTINEYNTISDCIYNVYVTGSGEIVSGRVVDLSGDPVADATVTAIDTVNTYSDTTDSRGIFALVKVPSNKSLTVSVSKAGMAFKPKTVTTGKSQNYTSTSGNVWGVNFTESLPQVPTVQNMTIAATAGQQCTVALQAVDDGQPSQTRFIITSLPLNGTLMAGTKTLTNADLPYIIPNYGNTVTYTSCAYFTGTDDFNFKANDGGTPPTGGDSSIASVTLSIAPPEPVTVMTMDFENGIPADWTVIDGYNDGKTWMNSNPKNRTSSYWTSKFAMVDSDWAGQGVAMDEELITPPIDCSGMVDITLAFSHSFYRYEAEICDVDVRVAGGPWQNVARYTGTHKYGNVNIDLSTAASRKHDVQIRWHYYNASWDYYWGIDNIALTASVMSPPMDGDFEMDCDVDSRDFADFIPQWLSDQSTPGFDAKYDMNSNGIVDFEDFSRLAANWLKTL